MDEIQIIIGMGYASKNGITAKEFVDSISQALEMAKKEISTKINGDILKDYFGDVIMLELFSALLKTKKCANNIDDRKYIASELEKIANHIKSTQMYV